MKAFLFAMVTVISFTSFASGLRYSKNNPTEREISDLREKTDTVFFAMKGINGTGITACEEKSGIPFAQLSEEAIESSLFVHCLRVTTETTAAAKALKVLFPIGKMVGKIFVVSEYVGKIEIQ